MKRSSIAAVLILLTAMSVAALAPATAGEVTALVRVELGRGLDQRALVEHNVDILAIRPDGLADLAVTDEQLAWLSSLGILVAVLDRAAFAATTELDANLGTYYTYVEMQASIDSLASRFPGLTHIDTLGTSIEGRLIRAIKISDNAAIDEDEPEALIIGCLHAREIMTVEITLRFAAYLLEHYADPRVASIVDNREVWIAPMINPDGHVYVELNHEDASYTWWRKNRRLNDDGSYGVDLNRNFGYMWGYDDVGSSPTPSSVLYRGTGPFSEPETQAVRDFCAAHEFTVNVSYHSYSELILYPWGYAPVYPDDQELFAALGDSLSEGNDYLVGNSATGAIYITNGGSDDWMYGDAETKNRIYGFTVEVNTYEEGGFGPPESLILPTFDKLLELNLRILEYADNPGQMLGPKSPAMNAITMLNPPNYEISWQPAEGDLNPAVSYELVEYANMGTTIDSCEAGDDLWTPDGFTISTARVKVGAASWYSGTGNNLKNTLSMTYLYPMSYPATFTCWLWYDIETNYDYAYFEVSADEGVTWSPVPGNRTTDSDPNGVNRGNGITGKTGNWTAATFDLTGFLTGGDGYLLVRFSYETDGAVYEEGLYVDLTSPTVRCDGRTTLASGLRETWYHRWPSEPGTYVYLVRGFDADGQQGHWSDLATHVVDDLTDVPRIVPRGSALAQNHPNPFNPTTAISFLVGEDDAPAGRSAPVRLELFDVAGKRIAVLVDAPLEAGGYSVPWDARSTSGRPVAAGVYFARLAVGERTFTRKLVLVR